MAASASASLGEALAAWVRADEEPLPGGARLAGDHEGFEPPFSLSPPQRAAVAQSPARWARPREPPSGGTAGGPAKRALFEGMRASSEAAATARHDALVARVASDLASGGASAGGETAGWALVSRRLEASGFRPLTLSYGGQAVGLPLGGAAGVLGVPSSAAARSALLDVLTAYETRGRTLEKSTLDAGAGRSRANAAEEAARRAEARYAELAKTVAGLERQLEESRALLRRARDSATAGARGGEAEIRSLRARNQALGTAVRQREAEVQRMQERLQKEVVERDAVRRERERVVLAGTHPAARSTADSRTIELVSAYESARRNREAEIEFLRAEVRRLSSDLATASNTPYRNDSLSLSESKTFNRSDLLSLAQTNGRSAANATYPGVDWGRATAPHYTDGPDCGGDGGPAAAPHRPRGDSGLASLRAVESNDILRRLADAKREAEGAAAEARRQASLSAAKLRSAHTALAEARAEAAEQRARAQTLEAEVLSRGPPRGTGAAAGGLEAAPSCAEAGVRAAEEVNNAAALYSAVAAATAAAAGEAETRAAADLLREELAGVAAALQRTTVRVHEAERRAAAAEAAGAAAAAKGVDARSRAIVSEACRNLRISEPSQLPSAVKKLTAALSALPKMERWVREVCALVTAASVSTAASKPGMGGGGAVPPPLPPEEALAHLRTWTAARRELHHLREFAAALSAQLAPRTRKGRGAANGSASGFGSAGGVADGGVARQDSPPMTLGAVAAAVKCLIAYEAQTQRSGAPLSASGAPNNTAGGGSAHAAGGGGAADHPTGEGNQESGARGGPRRQDDGGESPQPVGGRVAAAAAKQQGHEGESCHAARSSAASVATEGGGGNGRGGGDGGGRDIGDIGGESGEEQAQPVGGRVAAANKGGAGESAEHMVTHVMRLFDMTSPSGVLPKANELYLFAQEQRTFLRAARAAVNAPPDASLQTILQFMQRGAQASARDVAAGMPPASAPAAAKNHGGESRNSGLTSARSTAQSIAAELASANEVEAPVRPPPGDRPPPFGGSSVAPQAGAAGRPAAPILSDGEGRSTSGNSEGTPISGGSAGMPTLGDSAGHNGPTGDGEAAGAPVSCGEAEAGAPSPAGEKEGEAGAVSSTEAPSPAGATVSAGGGEVAASALPANPFTTADALASVAGQLCSLLDVSSPQYLVTKAEALLQQAKSAASLGALSATADGFAPIVEELCSILDIRSPHDLVTMVELLLEQSRGASSAAPDAFASIAERLCSLLDVSSPHDLVPKAEALLHEARAAASAGAPSSAADAFAPIAQHLCSLLDVASPHDLVPKAEALLRDAETLMRLLRVQHPDDLVPTARELLLDVRAQSKALDESTATMSALCEMLQVASPDSLGPRITELLRPQESESTATMFALCELLQVASPDQLVPRITEVLRAQAVAAEPAGATPAAAVAATAATAVSGSDPDLSDAAEPPLPVPMPPPPSVEPSALQATPAASLAQPVHPTSISQVMHQTSSALRSAAEPPPPVPLPLVQPSVFWATPEASLAQPISAAPSALHPSAVSAPPALAAPPGAGPAADYAPDVDASFVYGAQGAAACGYSGYAASYLSCDGGYSGCGGGYSGQAQPPAPAELPIPAEPSVPSNATKPPLPPDPAESPEPPSPAKLPTPAEPPLLAEPREPTEPPGLSATALLHTHAASAQPSMPPIPAELPSPAEHPLATEFPVLSDNTTLLDARAASALLAAMPMLEKDFADYDFDDEQMLGLGHSDSDGSILGSEYDFELG